ncbi:MAG: hypothetical protein N3F63_02360 [Thermoplasmata archaeon]|nr:hypothetical protein [Thermoplasmata archaeon]
MIMCNWEDICIGKNAVIPADVLRTTCEILQEVAKQRRTIAYGELIDLLKEKYVANIYISRYINRFTIGRILDEVNKQVANTTNPSIYPSSIVVTKDTGKPGDGFWEVQYGTQPPARVQQQNRVDALTKYQQAVFDVSKWSCNC